MTPMQEQYEKIKSEYKDFIVLFRLGDFYEVFDEDAITLSKVLGLTLTGRGKDENRRHMAGIPYHALPNYLPRMVKAGLKVAVADQTEEAVPGKLVERKVTKVVTSGTITDDNSLDATNNNYIASVYIHHEKKGNIYSLAFCDITTGEFKVYWESNRTKFLSEVERLNPAELLLIEKQVDEFIGLKKVTSQNLDKDYFDFNKSEELLKKHFQIANFKGFGFDEFSFFINTAGALLRYVNECQRTELRNITKIELHNTTDRMFIDRATVRNLELFFSSYGSQENTIYSNLDKCITPLGKRLLRRELSRPLLNKTEIEARYKFVQKFYDERVVLSEVRDLLREVSDIERLIGKIGNGTINPKELLVLVQSINSSISIFSKLNDFSEISLLKKYLTKLNVDYSDKLNEFTNFITTSIIEDPAVSPSQGHVINNGINEQIDEYRNIKKDSRSILADIQSREIASTGIGSLKISFNQVFGYYIEVTRTHSAKVPAHYIRKQTLANAERYITEELKVIEEKILGAEEKLIKIENEIYIRIVSKCVEFIQSLLYVAEIISLIDLISNFAQTALDNRFTAPKIISNQEEEIVDGRHPVVEKLVWSFTPNTTNFSNDSLIHIITGPNMSGKSTYIRQIAVLYLLAQIGSFVPADKMNFQIVDRIFTRVGASDNISSGESTFMVEMNETANILNNASSKSLIILDEVGRGTSTYDGVAIAWSIVEFIVDKIKAKTLFATHYHELTALENEYESIKNFNVEVSEEGEQIYFLHKIIHGGASKSYGVHVAKLAGVPGEVVVRANEILRRFEGQEERQETRNKKQDIRDTKYVESKSEEEKLIVIPDNSELKTQNSKLSTGPKVPKKIHPEQIGLI